MYTLLYLFVFLNCFCCAGSSMRGLFLVVVGAAALPVRCAVSLWGLSRCGAWTHRGGCSPGALRGLVVVASPFVEPRAPRHLGFDRPGFGAQSTDSAVVLHRLSCSAACGIFPQRGSNPCRLHRQADSYPLGKSSPLAF